MEINEENNKKYGTYDLPSIFLSSIEEKWSPELQKSFESYKQLLVSRGYFKDVTEGSKEYEERLSKAKERFYEKYSQEKKTETNTNNTNTTKTEETNNDNPPPPREFKTNVTEEQKKEAEVLKTKGNDSFKAQDFENAIKYYSEAIEIYSNAIYYCNRGTSYGKLSKHVEALEDFKTCILLDSKYVRGYDRLGCTYMKIGNLQEAIKTFQEGLLIDPKHEDLQSHLTEAQEQSQGDMGGMGNLGGMPNMEQMQQMINNPEVLQNLGPMQDMLQNNPQLMNVAMNLMQDPNFQQTMMNMMNNPAMSNIFNQMMQGGVPPGNDEPK